MKMKENKTVQDAKIMQVAFSNNKNDNLDSTCNTKVI